MHATAPHLKHAHDQLLTQKNELNAIIAEYTALTEVLDELQAVATKDCLVPICGSNMVLAHGQLINTNTVLCQLSKEVYVRRTITNCVDKTLKTRRDFAESVLKDNDIKLRELQTMMKIPPSDPGPGIHLNSEGFYEIIEHEPPTIPTTQNNPPLIEEIPHRPKQTQQQPPPPHHPRSTPPAPTIVNEVIERMPTPLAPPPTAHSAGPINSAKSLFARELDELHLPKRNR